MLKNFNFLRGLRVLGHKGRIYGTEKVPIGGLSTPRIQPGNGFFDIRSGCGDTGAPGGGFSTLAL